MEIEKPFIENHMILTHKYKLFLCHSFPTVFLKNVCRARLSYWHSKVDISQKSKEHYGKFIFQGTEILKITYTHT